MCVRRPGQRWGELFATDKQTELAEPYRRIPICTAIKGGEGEINRWRDSCELVNPGEPRHGSQPCLQHRGEGWGGGYLSSEGAAAAYGFFRVQ